MTENRKKTPKPRTKGRPDSVDGVGPEALLKATIETLRHTSPQSLTLAAVAQQAGVHPALIRYYFGSKDGLLTATTRHLVEGEHDTVRPSIQGDAPLTDKLTARLRGMIDLIEANPHFHRLVLDQIYQKSIDQSDDGLLGRVTARGMKLTVSLLHDSRGEAIRPIDPRFLHIALIGLTEFFAAATPLLRELFGDDADPKQIKERYIHFLTDLITHGITMPSANPD